MNKLKIYKKAMIYLTAGFITLSATGCKDNVDKDTTKIEASLTKNKEVTNKKIEDNDRQKEEKKKNELVIFDKKLPAYLKQGVSLKKSISTNSKKLKKISKYQKVNIIGEKGDFDFIKYNNKKGYVKKSNLEKINNDYVEVDISEQKMKYFNKDNKKIFSSSVVTGLATDPERATVMGCYKIYLKQLNRDLVGANYTSHVDYWMPFYKGYGLHDADWRSSFGGDIYKYAGSHGCVNLPDPIAKKLYQKSKVGTKVLIHK